MDDQQLIAAIHQINVRLGQIDERIAAHIASHNRDYEGWRDHEERIRRIEAWKYAVPGSVVIAVGAVVAALL